MQDHPHTPRYPSVPAESGDGAVEPQPAQGVDALALMIVLSLCLLLGLALLLAGSC